MGNARGGPFAIGVLFLASGLAVGTFVSRVPALKDRVSANDATLGMCLLFMTFGAVFAFRFSRRVVARWGAVPSAGGAGILFVASLPVVAMTRTPVALASMLFVAGAMNGTMDVAMNVAATNLERHTARSRMSAFHAIFSAGGGFGALLGAFAAARLSLTSHFALAAAFLGIALGLGVNPDDGAATAPAPSPAAGGWGRSVLALGGIAFFSSLGEGAMADWSALYLRDVAKTPESTAAFGYAGFSFAMVAGRLSANFGTRAAMPVTLVRAGGLIAALGLAAGLSSRQPPAALFAFAAVGAGLGVVIPQVLMAAATLPGRDPAQVVAAVSTLSYAGFLVGPPLIGAVAQVATLRVALWVVVVAAAAVAAGARSLAPGHSRRIRDSAPS